MKLFLLFVAIFSGINSAWAANDFSAIDRYVNEVKDEVSISIT